MATKIVCDRCGAEVASTDYEVCIGATKFDGCDVCQQLFYEVMRNFWNSEAITIPENMRRTRERSKTKGQARTKRG